MRSFDKIIPQIIQTIEKYNLIQKGEHILIAVSGGCDSIALLHILYQLSTHYNLKLGVVHYEHGIRGEASLRDAEFVEEMTKKLNLPFYIGHGKALAYARRKKLSLEAAARKLRYDFFNQVLQETRADKLALGHTADDQIEEILRRLIRGTAWVDLGGMPIKREKFIRPLIFMYKDKIKQLLEEEAIPYMIDSTNFDIQFFRNRVRHQLIPLLLKFSPRFKENLLEMSLIWQEEREWLDTFIEKAIAKSVKQTPKGKQIDLNLFRPYHPALQRRILVALLKEIPLPFTRRHLNALLALASPGGPHKFISLPKGWLGYKEGHYLYITSSIPPQPDYYYQIEKPGKVEIKELNISLEIKLLENKGEKINQTPKEVFVDFDKVSFPLEIRPYQPGDKFYPLGGKGSKKIKDFFIDLKIPYAERKKYPLVISQEKIIWVAGLSMDERIKPGSETRLYLMLKISKTQNP